jgi:hypothetical protein
MRRISRRTLVKGGVAAAAAGGLGGLVLTRRAHAFGEIPASYLEATVPEERRVDSILEIYMFGGVSQHESYYIVPEFGAADNTHWHLFSNGADNEVDTVLTACQYAGGELLQPFAQDDAGRLVHFGPFVDVHRQQAHLLERTRVVVTKHFSQPHEVAVPLALTGRRPGSQNLAGLGTHIARYFQVRDATALPRSYILLPPSTIQRELVEAATATGRHPADARPLDLQVSATLTSFVDLLERSKIGSKADAYDAFVEGNLSRFAARLTRDGSRVRSPALDVQGAVHQSVSLSESLRQLLDDSYFLPTPHIECGIEVEEAPLQNSLQLAAHLLTDVEFPARYVCVIDGGFLPVSTEAGGYDTHRLATPVQAQNLFYCLKALTSIVNAPGENDPQKLDLDRTLIVLTTEFGRTPNEEGTRGRGHWPHGFPTVLIGGPLRPEASAANCGIHGAIGPDGIATKSVTPTEIRAGLLMALGIWPFENESFNVSDVAGVVDESSAAVALRQALFAI